jgi:hypothetical protein
MGDPTTVRMGDRFIHRSSGVEYVLARLPGSMNKTFLVNISNGGHWSTPIDVDDLGNLTRQEVKNLIGSSVFNEWKVKVRVDDE